MDTFEKVKSIIVDILGVEEDRVTPEASLPTLSSTAASMAA